MSQFHVRYYYLATGMEGYADEEDYGIIEADNREEAIKMVAHQKYPIDIMYGPNDTYSTRDFFLGCLSAEIVK